VTNRRRAAIAVTTALAATVVACANPPRDTTPMCSLGESLNALVLEAQAVPAADRVPCIRLLPAGWSVFSVDTEQGRARFSLSSDRAGSRAVEITFSSRCDTSGATRIPSDENGTRRFERIEEVTPRFVGTRYYTFKGGCVAYRFELDEEGRALANEASLALSFIRRQAIDAELRKDSDGRVGL
jgi:hypothetical protein